MYRKIYKIGKAFDFYIIKHVKICCKNNIFYAIALGQGLAVVPITWIRS